MTAQPSTSANANAPGLGDQSRAIIFPPFDLPIALSYRQRRQDVSQLRWQIQLPFGLAASTSAVDSALRVVPAFVKLRNDGNEMNGTFIGLYGDLGHKLLITGSCLSLLF